jgi:hypothetical protein
LNEQVKRYSHRVTRRREKATPVDLMPLITTDYCGRRQSKGNKFVIGKT